MRTKPASSCKNFTSISRVWFQTFNRVRRRVDTRRGCVFSTRRSSRNEFEELLRRAGTQCSSGATVTGAACVSDINRDLEGSGLGRAQGPASC